MLSKTTVVHAKNNFFPGKIIIISGPSGSGKTTLHKRLLGSPKLKNKVTKSISVTTRSKRSGEENGRDYLFITRDEFLKNIDSGYFLEWQKVFENYYGTPKEKVLELLKNGSNVLLCIDVKGAAVVAEQFPQAIKIFIKAPSLAVLKKRLMDRASESKDALKIRLETARKELKEAKKYDYVVVNDDLSRAFKYLETFVSKELMPTHTSGHKN